MLIAMVVQIDDISRPVAGQSGATGTELDLARRLGELQGDALGLVPSPMLDRTETAAARQAGFDAPVQNAEDLSNRIGKLDHEQGDATRRPS